MVASDDVVENGNPVAVLSFNYWQRRFDADAKIVNESISINGHPFTVVGVAPRGFHSMILQLRLFRRSSPSDNGHSFPGAGGCSPL